MTQKLKALLREPVPAAKATLAEPDFSNNYAKPGESESPGTTAESPGVDQECDARLESLPAEIRGQILADADLQVLHALIRASPVFYRQYLLDRKFFLTASLDVTLGIVAIDAHAVQRLEHGGSNTAHHVTKVLENWRMNLRHRSSWCLKPADALTEDEVTSMISFYLRTISPMARHLVCWASDGPAKQIINLKTHPLSTTELQRFIRAVYRFQLLCYVTSVLSSNIATDNAKSLIYNLEPWEAEELYSFYQSSEGVYDKIFDRISGDVHPENPRFDDQSRPPTPDGAFEFDNSWTRRNFAEGTTLRGGLSLLSTVLSDIGANDQERLVNIMQRSIVSSYIPISGHEGLFGQSKQQQRRQEEPTIGDSLTEERAPCPFCGDNQSVPPLAWTLIWGGTYSNLYGWYTGDELRQWAYVFWDGVRLRKYGGDEFLAKQWEQCWWEDPRETLF
ncbi:hypothetical protein N0V93_009725 [Gnomoniopsis smithogilvyi]|uniref:Uncharacterized protein n=1 Tax=Gnomoniopsis smithogilvyi TaxID=1191159 RepID=A0A9W8YNP6_9PEZI|nr:hypothetical protein N0V93_009725 [Gnomoniopsis smithogilvyi]